MPTTSGPLAPSMSSGEPDEAPPVSQVWNRTSRASAKSLDDRFPVSVVEGMPDGGEGPP